MMLNGEKYTKIAKVVFLCFSEHCHGNMCNLNVIVVLESISRGQYLLFEILFSSKLKQSIFSSPEPKAQYRMAMIRRLSGVRRRPSVIVHNFK